MEQRTRSLSSAWGFPSYPQWSKTMVDVSDPDWKQKVQDGILSCNAATRTEVAMSSFPPLEVIYEDWYKRFSFSPWEFKGLKSISVQITTPQFALESNWPAFNTAMAKVVNLGGRLPEVPEDSSVIHTALSDKLASGIALTMVSYAERLKTLKLFKDTVSLLRHPFINARNQLRISRAALRGNPNAFKTVMDEANTRWLEGRYGWRPLCYEVMAMFDAAAQGDNQRITVRRNPLPQQSDVTETVRSWTTGLAAGVIDVKYDLEYKTRYGQTGDFNVAFSNVARDYGLYDVVGTAWELVPYSFVVDWYVNIGQMLGSLQALLMLDERVGWDKVSSTVKASYVPRVTVPGNLTAIKGVKHIFREFGPWSPVEMVSMWDRYPRDSFAPVLDFRCNLDIPKIIDQVALLRQVLKGR